MDGGSLDDACLSGNHIVGDSCRASAGLAASPPMAGLDAGGTGQWRDFVDAHWSVRACHAEFGIKPCRYGAKVQPLRPAFPVGLPVGQSDGGSRAPGIGFEPLDQQRLPQPPVHPATEKDGLNSAKMRGAPHKPAKNGIAVASAFAQHRPHADPPLLRRVPLGNAVFPVERTMVRAHLVRGRGRAGFYLRGGFSFFQ